MRKSLTAPSTLKASADGLIVITLARLTLTILQAQSIAKGSIIEQLQNSLSGQKNTIPNGLDSRNYCRAISRNYSTAAKLPYNAQNQSSHAHSTYYCTGLSTYYNTGQ
jgi:hypothetical protein